MNRSDVSPAPHLSRGFDPVLRERFGVTRSNLVADACPLSPLDVLTRWPADQPVALLHDATPSPFGSKQSVEPMPIRRGWGFSLFSAPDPNLAIVRRLEDGLRWSNVDAALRQARHSETLHLATLSYELGGLVESLPEPAAEPDAPADLWLMPCLGFALFDHASQAWHLGGSWAQNPPTAWRSLNKAPTPTQGYQAENLALRLSPSQHVQAVQNTRDAIARGDLFQLNLTNRITGGFSGSARALATHWLEQSPAPFSAYLDLAGPESLANPPMHRIISGSPELLLDVDRHRALTRPIKGTLPGDRPADELRVSRKDQAELHMITDLLRNDLGRVCRYGTVRVAQPRAIESFPPPPRRPVLHHGVSTVTGELHPARSPEDLLRAMWPGGSITGAPKVQAMTMIRQLEPVRRGLYCGAIGYIQGERQCWNLAIRTATVTEPTDGRPASIGYGCGGGIVADSQPRAELREALVKSRSFRQALRSGRGKC